MSIRTTILLLPLLLITTPVGAATGLEGALHFDVGIPQGELDDELDGEAYGLGLQAFYAPNAGPIAFGIDLAWMNYGHETREEPFSTTIPDVTVDVKTMNNVAQAFFVLRLQTPEGPIRGYVDGLVGVNYLYTETTIEDDDFDDVASSTNQDDAAFAWGGGGGVKIRLWHEDEKVGGLQEVTLDVGVRYIAGGEAEYLEEGSIRRTGDRIAFDTIESRTDLLRVHVGVGMAF